MYVIRYEKTLPPWLISQDEVEADDPEDAVKEFYKRHDSFEDKIHSVYERTSMYTYQKVMQMKMQCYLGDSDSTTDV